MRRIRNYPLIQMNWTKALISVPAGFVRQPSGIFLPTESSSRPTVVGNGDQLNDGTPISRDAFFVMAEPPSSAAQMRVVLEEDGVGLSQSSPDDLTQLVGELNFEIGMLAVSKLSSHVSHIRGDTDAQLALAPEIFGDRDLADAIARLARSEDGLLEIFPDQHAAILQRLLVLSGRDAQLGEPGRAEQVAFNRAWLAAGTLTDLLDHDRLASPDDRSRWVAFLIQNGTYNRAEDSLSSMIRPQILLSDIAKSETFRFHPHFCEIDTWHQESYGLSLSKQFSLGLVLSGVAKIFDNDASIGQRSLISGEAFNDVLAKLDCEQGRGLITASRDWYRREFKAREDNLANAAWDRIPFEKRPLLKLSNGQLLTTSRRALEGWLGSWV